MDKKKRDELFAKVVMALTGVFCGFFIIYSTDFGSLFGNGPGSLIFTVAAAAVLLMMSYFVQSVFHEFGHLVFGLMSGYKFVSFRIGRFMVVRENGRLAVKFYTVVGTGGQCLMMPPPWEDGIPYKLYNLGGVVMNLVSGGAFLWLWLASSRSGFWPLVYVMLFITGIASAVMNGVPLSVNGISNDGRNALLLGKNKTALRAFWLQLYVNGLMSGGERVGRMPKDWFFLPEGDDLLDPIICTVGVMRYNYFFDTHDFSAAEETAEYMIKAQGLLGVHKNELLCELVFLRILRDGPAADVDRLLTPPAQPLHPLNGGLCIAQAPCLCLPAPLPPKLPPCGKVPCGIRKYGEKIPLFLGGRKRARGHRDNQGESMRIKL